MKPIVKLIKKNKMKGGFYFFYPSCPTNDSLDTIMNKYRVGTGTYNIKTLTGYVSNKKIFFNKIKMAEVNKNLTEKKLDDYKFYIKYFANTHTLYAIPKDSDDYKSYFLKSCNNKSMKTRGYTDITIGDLKIIYKNYLNNSIWKKYLN